MREPGVVGAALQGQPSSRGRADKGIVRHGAYEGKREGNDAMTIVMVFARIDLGTVAVLDQERSC